MIKRITGFFEFSVSRRIRSLSYKGFSKSALTKVISYPEKGLIETTRIMAQENLMTFIYGIIYYFHEFF